MPHRFPALLALPLLAACGGEEGTGPTTSAAVAGVVSSPARGPVENVTVTIGAKSDVTNAAGFFAIGGLAAGASQLTFSTLPAECDNPAPLPVGLTNAEVTDGSVSVTCRGRVSGRVTSPEFGPMPGLTVAVEGTAISTTTNATGNYVLAGIETDTVIVLVSGLVGDCRTPLPRPVAVPPGRTATISDIVVSCAPLFVVFTAAGEGGEDDIYIMKVDGTGRRQLTATTDIERFPALSPDGKRIVFNRGEVQLSTIWTLHIDSTEAVSQASGAQSFPRPRWMFDGTRIVSFNQRGTIGQPQNAIVIHTLGVTSPVPVGDLLGIIPTPAYQDARAVSVGTTISFSSPQDHIQLHDLDAAEPSTTLLPLDTLREIRRLNWAPNGSRVVFESGTVTNGNIVTRSTDPAGTTIVLTSGPEDDSEPVYSPDGTLIYFIRNGAFWRMNADGTNQVEIVPAASFGASAIDVR